jgi:two-component system response regulator PilR (NtrC family)
MSKSQVLVVDDEADIRELLGLTLARMGLDAHCASSIAEAYALLAKDTYDLCLTDMRLPDGDGLTVVDFVAKNHPNLPVAVITAHGSTENAVAALKAGAFDYLAKPVSLDQLRTLVRSALKLPRSAQRRAQDVNDLRNAWRLCQGRQDVYLRCARTRYGDPRNCYRVAK